MATGRNDRESWLCLAKASHSLVTRVSNYSADSAWVLSLTIKVSSRAAATKAVHGQKRVQLVIRIKFPLPSHDDTTGSSSSPYPPYASTPTPSAPQTAPHSTVGTVRNCWVSNPKCSAKHSPPTPTSSPDAAIASLSSISGLVLSFFY